MYLLKIMIVVFHPKQLIKHVCVQCTCIYILASFIGEHCTTSVSPSRSKFGQ